MSTHSLTHTPNRNTQFENVSDSNASQIQISVIMTTCFYKEIFLQTLYTISKAVVCFLQISFNAINLNTDYQTYTFP